MQREEKPTALYRFFDSDNRLLYVGISFQLGMRMSRHRNSRRWREIARIELTWHENRTAAAAAEDAAIKTESPLWNVCGTPKHGRPHKFLAVVDILQRQIDSGRWPEGGQLQSATNIAAQIGIAAPVTVRKAIDHLIQVGVLVGRRRRGVYVAERTT